MVAAAPVLPVMVCVCVDAPPVVATVDVLSPRIKLPSWGAYRYQPDGKEDDATSNIAIAPAGINGGSPVELY